MTTTTATTVKTPAYLHTFRRRPAGTPFPHLGTRTHVSPFHPSVKPSSPKIVYSIPAHGFPPAVLFPSESISIRTYFFSSRSWLSPLYDTQDDSPNRGQAIPPFLHHHIALLPAPSGPKIVSPLPTPHPLPQSTTQDHTPPISPAIFYRQKVRTETPS